MKSVTSGDEEDEEEEGGDQESSGGSKDQRGREVDIVCLEGTKKEPTPPISKKGKTIVGTSKPPLSKKAIMVISPTIGKELPEHTGPLPKRTNVYNKLVHLDSLHVLGIATSRKIIKL